MSPPDTAFICRKCYCGNIRTLKQLMDHVPNRTYFQVLVWNYGTYLRRVWPNITAEDIIEMDLFQLQHKVVTFGSPADRNKQEYFQLNLRNIWKQTTACTRDRRKYAVFILLQSQTEF